MAGMIATLLAAPKTINIVDEDNRGPQRHVYEELLQLQAINDAALASPYLEADAAVSIAANGGTTGNLTITLNFPKYGVAVTTGNIIYSAAAATVQTAVDAALAGETVLATYVADDVKVGTCANMSSAACPITANGTTVAKVHMVVTTANVDMDVAAPAVTASTIGTGNRPAEAVLNEQGLITPASLPTPQGTTPAVADYDVSGDIHSLSPGLKTALVNEMQYSEDAILAAFFRTQLGCVD